MRRDVLLLEEMIQAAVQAVALVEGVAVEDLAADGCSNKSSSRG